MTDIGDTTKMVPGKPYVAPMGTDGWRPEPGTEVGPTLRSRFASEQLCAALVAAQLELRNPVRNREVTVKSDKGNYSFAYATLDSILDDVRPVLARNGLALVQIIVFDNAAPAMRTMLIHNSGSMLSCDVPMHMDRPGNQALGSAMTYARRYGVIGLLALAAEDDDDGNEADPSVGTVRRTDTFPRATGRDAPPVNRSGKPQPPHLIHGQRAVTGAGGDIVKAAHKKLCLADWQAVANLTGKELAEYEEALKQADIADGRPV